MRSLERCIFLLMTASCAYDWTVVPDAGSTKKMLGERCDSNTDCDDTTYCKWFDGVCGAERAGGTCTTRPLVSTCPASEESVCPCTDLRKRGGACQLATTGTDHTSVCK